MEASSFQIHAIPLQQHLTARLNFRPGGDLI